jgi:copper chaperone CopZ
LQSLPDVAAVEINFSEKTATVTAKGARRLTKDEVENALKAKGYGVVGFTEKAKEPAGQ